MTEAQMAQLVKMANQIALNMAAEGDAQVDRTAAHILRFWTPAMRQKLLEHTTANADGVPSLVQQVVEVLGSRQ